MLCHTDGWNLSTKHQTRLRPSSTQAPPYGPHDTSPLQEIVVNSTIPVLLTCQHARYLRFSYLLSQGHPILPVWSHCLMFGWIFQRNRSLWMMRSETTQVLTSTPSSFKKHFSILKPSRRLAGFLTNKGVKDPKVSQPTVQTLPIGSLLRHGWIPTRIWWCYKENEIFQSLYNKSATIRKVRRFAIAAKRCVLKICNLANKIISSKTWMQKVVKKACLDPLRKLEPRSPERTPRRSWTLHATNKQHIKPLLETK